MFALLLSFLSASALAAEDVDADGFTTAEGDCDDTAPAIHPGAVETVNGVDDDCDYMVDDDTNVYDDDRDGYTEDAGDCDDAKGLSFPGAYEWSDALDNDCEDNDCDGEIEQYVGWQCGPSTPVSAAGLLLIAAAIGRRRRA